MRAIVKSLLPQPESSGQSNLPQRPAATATAYSQRELVRWSLLVRPDPDGERS